ncbi:MULTISPECIES: response regulator [unclassified Butyrivibrio]|uniref:response regulator n=1 Tax=unclassified Butyrivibrio TaxID=2639466 RepID=UPI000400C3D9|nr:MULTISPECIES: response regulator [unclassified Butyrivibrio]
MAKNATIISSNETFMVKGLIMKLKDVGITASFCPDKMEDLQKKQESADVFIYYLDEIAPKTLIYLKDLCLETHRQVIFICNPLEYEEALTYLPESHVHSFFERPLRMDDFLETMNKFYMDEMMETNKKSVLIVDDDVSYMRTIRDWLKDEYKVSMANSGIQAITWLAKNKADLILLDYEMPVTSGPKVLEMFKSDMSIKDIPVMFLTSKGDKASIVRVLALKPADYILKTIDKNSLHIKIDNFFRMR